VLLHQDQRQIITQRVDPNLIMANTILQQSAQELVQQIEDELLENPALDVIEEEVPCAGDCLEPATCPYCSQRQDNQHRPYPLEPLDVEPELFPEMAGEMEEEYDPVGNLEAELTLQDHLLALLRTAVPESDFRIGEYLINSLDQYGWLDGSVEEIAADLNVDSADVLRVLKVIQTFDPPGVGARDLQECMLIQLRFLREEGQGNPVAERMIRSHFDDFVNRRYAKLARALRVPEDTIRQSIDFIRTHLNPYPASQFRPPWSYKPSDSKSAIKPDVIIRRTEVGYEVDVAGTEPFLLRVNPTYRDIYNSIRSGNADISEEERKHFAEYVERAELFIKNILQRRKTLRLITKAIIDYQQGFLATGSRAYLRPLTRTQIARMINMHESTVSRATARKYVQLPNQEVVPFDIFFNSSISIRTAIEEIISGEDPSNPLSDRQIVDLLKERGIYVARRTIVKYREQQKLLASTRRRR
jgi:RNA polymerase sigma-54 factor